MVVLLNNKAIKYISLVITILFILSISFALVISISIDTFNNTQLGQITKEDIAVPIVMYHSIMKSSKEMGKYVITPTEFENDLAYLKNRSYSSITMTELINYVYNDAVLPSKPVIITFDDGNLNNYIYGKPLLQRYDMKAIISIVGQYTELFSKASIPTNSPDYAFVSWDQIKEISHSGYFEIQNHSYSLHSINKNRYGIKRKQGESLESYQNILASDIEMLQEKLNEVTGIKPNTFTYPFGYSNKESKVILKNLGFKATLSCAEGINIIKKNEPDVLFGLKRKNRPHGVSSETFFKKLCP
jgi:peptidoglycan/xylan/chitin deacetylase (PgdA/CDA1 family)